MRIVSIIHYPLLIRVVMTASFGLVMFGDWDYEYWLTIALPAISTSKLEKSQKNKGDIL